MVYWLSPSEWLKLILNVTLCSMLLLFYLRLLLICPRVTCGLDWVVLMWFVIFDSKCRTEAWKEGKGECGKRVSECDCGFEECVIGCYFLDGLCPFFKVTWSKKWDIIEKWGFPGGSDGKETATHNLHYSHTSKYIYIYAHGSILYNSEKLKTTWMSINSRLVILEYFPAKEFIVFKVIL